MILVVSVEEIKKLYEKFCNISSSIVADGVIDQEEFKQALGLKVHDLHVVC